MDGGAWWATVHGVAKSWARLSVSLPSNLFKLRAASRFSAHSPALDSQVQKMDVPWVCLSWGSLSALGCPSSTAWQVDLL